MVVRKFIRLLLLVMVILSITGCGSAPVESDNASAQRNRAEKAQSELGAGVSKQK